MIREASLRGILEAGLGGGKRVIRGEEELPEKREQPPWWVRGTAWRPGGLEQGDSSG